MYTKGSKECLLNAKQLIEDARSLIEKESFGTAQSLCVTAFEEIGKAVILELANLGFVSGRVVQMAMRDHRPKRIMLIGLEQSKLLLGENLASQASQYILDKTKLEKLRDEMRKDIGHLGKKRQSGFYVQVRPGDGRITNSPRRISLVDAQITMNKAEVFLGLGRILCDFFRDVKKRPRTDVRLRKVLLPKGNEPTYTMTIVWDEI